MFTKDKSKKVEFAEKVDREVYKYKIEFLTVNNIEDFFVTEWISPLKLKEGINSYINILLTERTLTVGEDVYTTSNIVKMKAVPIKKAKLSKTYVNSLESDWKYVFSHKYLEVEVDSIESL